MKFAIKIFFYHQESRKFLQNDARVLSGQTLLHLFWHRPHAESLWKDITSFVTDNILSNFLENVLVSTPDMKTSNKILYVCMSSFNDI